MSKQQFQYKAQDFQLQAVDSIANVFEGVQFTIEQQYNAISSTQDSLDLGSYSYGVRGLSKDDLTTVKNNIRTIQKHNQIIVDSVDLKGLHKLDYPVLDICMETGTGKTFAFIQTIFELNKRYQLEHFVIVVPSIAIKAGVLKSFETTAHYFQSLYHKRATVREYTTNKKAKSNLPQAVNEFINGNGLRVMVITNHAFNSVNNIINQDVEGFFGPNDEQTPIQAIANLRPVMILDEPQKLSGKATLEALDSFNPLFMMRYSATFNDVKNMMFVLDSHDAYRQKLVKKIGVTNFTLPKNARADLHFHDIGYGKDNKRYVKLKARNAQGQFIEVKVTAPDHSGESQLFAKTKNPHYQHLLIEKIDYANQSIHFDQGDVLMLGDTWSSQGDNHEQSLYAYMLDSMIEKHFAKEYELFQRGIKCLSLCFVGKVADYRDYDAPDQQGFLHQSFERIYQQYLEAYLNDINISDDYKAYLRKFSAQQVHGGYFASDRKSAKVLDESEGKNNDAVRALQQEQFDAIMRDKEKLLDFNYPMRFIFAHSALREGWDNPNIFQLCLMRISGSKNARIQEVGRGLRICVNQDLKRMDSEEIGVDQFDDINRLSVLSMEDDFIKGLQSEFDARRSQYKANPSIRFEELFRKLVDYDDRTRPVRKSFDGIIDQMIEAEAIDENAERIIDIEGIAEVIQQHKSELQMHSVDVNTLVKSIESQYKQSPRISNDREAKAKPRKYTVNPIKYKEHFQALWEALHQDVIYDIDLTRFDYVHEITRAIINDFSITDEYIHTQDAEMGEDMLFRQQTTVSRHKVQATMPMAEFIRKLQDQTMLSRNALIAILQAIPADKYQRIQANPHQAVELLVKKINHTIYDKIIDCVQVKKSSTNKHRQACVSNFVDQHLVATHYLELDKLPTYHDNGLYQDSIMPYDSIIPEKELSEQAASDKFVVVYAKLPKGINIPTPIHKQGINPDFGFVIEQKDGKKLYLIAEAKPTTNTDELRKLEDFKVKFLEKYFEGVDLPNVRYKTVASYADIQRVLDE